MADDNKTSINVEITTDGEQQLTKYIGAFDSLRTSITNLSTPINMFSSSVNNLDKDIVKFGQTIDNLVTKNEALSVSNDKFKKNLTDVSSSFSNWNNIVGLATEATGGWGIALSAGLTILTVYGDGIIKWAKGILEGTTTLSALGKVMKDNGIIANTLIQTQLKASQAAQGEITNLNVLYRATQDQNRSLEQKKGAIKALKDQWPETFKNLSDETIAAGKAAGAYKNLKDQIMAAAFAQAAKNKITDNAERILENEQGIAQERAKNIKLLKEQASAQNDFNNSLPKKDDSYSDRLRKNNDQYQSVIQQKLNAINRKNELLAISDKKIYNLTSDSKLLNIENDHYYQEIEKNIIKFGTGITTGVGNTLLANSTTKTNKKNQIDHGAELKKKATELSEKFTVAKQYYNVELKAFENQLKKKQITQDEYNDASKQVQEKYYASIRETIKRFNDQDLDETLQHQKDILSKDQQNVDQAILPVQKLAAEKQLITDKYNFEIQKAAESGKDTADIRQRYNQDMAAADKQFAQQRKDFELQTAQQVSNAAFSILQNNIKSQSDAKIKQLETQKTAELNNSSLTSAQKLAIEAKYKKQEVAEKTKAFKAEQKASMLQAVINGALAVTKVTAQTGVFAAFTIPAIIAETAIQVATIAAQKPPQYAKGGLHYQSDGKGALLSGYSRTDNTNAYLRSGEAVVVSEAMRNPWARNLVSAINVAHGGRDFSMANPGRGYAIGGIFTDGGNSNRYYNQPMNDQKDLANTIAYQMINNFPPVYVDVKDINSQQNILAQTVNRVNL